jgi:hypothetical protein
MASIVKKFSQHFKTLTAFSKEIGIEVKTLNKASSKYLSHRARYYNYEKNESPYTKGVDSDHIKIYPIDKEKSFAFAFHYSEVEKPLIVVTIRTGQKEDYQFEAAQYSEESFKDKMNQFLKVLQVLKDSSTLSKATLESSIRANFIKGQEINYTLEKDLVKQKINQEILLLKAKNKRNLDLKTELKEEIKSKKELLDKKVKEARKDFKIKELQEQLDKAWSEVKKISDKLENQLQIDADSRSLYQVERDLSDYKSQLVKIVEKHSNHLPKNIKADIKKEFIEN